MKKLKYITIITAFFLFGCNEYDVLVDDLGNPPTVTYTYDAGTADFSNYVALGTSMTSGFMDFSLYSRGQQFSYPNILHSSLKGVTGADQVFNNPDIESANGFNSFFSDLGNGVIAGRTELDVSIPGPVATSGELPSAFTGNKTELNNFGVPGIITPQILMPQTGTPNDPYENKYYTRFASEPGVSTIFSDAMATSPSFFTMWAGLNDVLGYAATGGSGAVPITLTPDFQGAFEGMISTLATSGVEGAVISLPPIVTMPFFQAVPYNAIPLDLASADQLNAGLGGVNNALDAIVEFMNHDPTDAARRKIQYSAGKNPILVIDESLEDLGPKFDNLPLSTAERAALVPYEQSRPLVDGELVLLSAAPYLGQEAIPGNAQTPIGVAIPLGFNIANGALSGDQYYLTQAEQVEIITARATFNGTMKAIVDGANQNGANIAWVNLDPFYTDVLGLSSGIATQLVFSQEGIDAADSQKGIVIEGQSLSPDFAPSGVFSTDGMHLNPRGHAIIANYIINALNTQFGTDVPEINVLDYPGVILKL